MATSRANSPSVISHRATIIGMRKTGLGVMEIAREMGIDRHSVSRWVKRWEEEGNVETRPRSGRPKCTSHQDEQRILQEVARNSLQSAAEVTRNLQLTCSIRTTQRRLHESNIDCYKPAINEVLTQAHKETRLGFALQHLVMDADAWKTVIFSDEKVFSTVESSPRQCWRPRDSSYLPQNIAEIKKCGRRTVSFWGWMWGYGPGELVKIEGQLTGLKYIEILENVLLPTVRKMAIPEPLPFKYVQDNSSVHQCKVVKDWFKDHPEIEVIDWPTKGCDMNPIEHLWAIMTRDWSVGEIRNQASVEARAMEVWESIRRRENLCSSLVKSIPNRLNEVVVARGGWSSY